MSEPAVQAMEHVAEKMEQTVVEDASKAVAGLYRKTQENLEQTLKNHLETDAAHAASIRKYFIDDEGGVHELRDGALHAVEKGDTSGIHSFIDSEGKAKGPTPEEMKEKWHARVDPEKPEERVKSEKITGPTELSLATEEARYANEDWGGKNYAALRYKDENGHEFILVGRSDNLRSHSERSIGKSFLGGEEHNIRELYTEREPCQAGPNCERWLDRHFQSENPDLEITHGVEYKNAIPKDDRDWAHQAYRERLEADHQAGIDTGTMGSHDFDAIGAQNQAASKVSTTQVTEKGL